MPTPAIVDDPAATSLGQIKWWSTSTYKPATGDSPLSPQQTVAGTGVAPADPVDELSNFMCVFRAQVDSVHFMLWLLCVSSSGRAVLWC